MALRLADHLSSVMDRLRYEPVAQRVRCSRGGVPVVDTTGAALVWEPRRVVPVYAVPEEDLTADLSPTEPAPVPDDVPRVLGPGRFALHLAEGETLDVSVGGTVLPKAAFKPADPDLAGMVVLDWEPFDWTEEDQPVMGHPHDLFKRIDVLRSERHVVVSLDGQVLADTHDARALHETGLPVRWYLPRDDVRMDLLEPSETTSVCAYKGRASYFSVIGAGPGGEDLAWTYPDPLHDAEEVRDRIVFFSERTDLTVDGEPVERPATFWSRR